MMRLKTLWFNKDIYYRNLRLLWPIALANAVILGVAVFTYLRDLSPALNPGFSLGLAEVLAADIVDMRGSDMTPILAIFSLLSALAVFSHIHARVNPAESLASPANLKSLFVTNYISGLTLAVFPFLLSFAVLLAGELIMGTQYVYYILVWVTVSVIFVFLFYSLAVLSGMLTGSMAAQAIFFIAFNLLASFLQSSLEDVFLRLYYGFSNPDGWNTTPLSPLLYIPGLYSGLTGQAPEIATVLFYFMAGIIITYAAYLLYGKRDVEAAGDVVSLKAAKPVFKYAVSFCSSILAVSIMISKFNAERTLILYICGFLGGGFVGYFASEMLLKKTLKVLKSVTGFLYFCAVMVLLALAVHSDFFGYESYVPNADNVEIMYVGDNYVKTVLVAMDPQRYDPRKDSYIFSDPILSDDPPQTLSDEMALDLRRKPGMIENRYTIDKALALHRYIAQNAEKFKELTAGDKARIRETGVLLEPRCYVTFIYRLKSGRIIERFYSIPYADGIKDELGGYLTDLLSTPEMMSRNNPILDMTGNDIRSVDISYVDKNGQTKTAALTSGMDAFLDAFKLDVRNVDPLAAYFSNYTANRLGIDITINFRNPISPFFIADTGMVLMQETHCTTFLTTDSINTIKYLLDSGIIKSEDLAEPEIQN